MSFNSHPMITGKRINILYGSSFPYMLFIYDCHQISYLDTTYCDKKVNYWYCSSKIELIHMFS